MKKDIVSIKKFQIEKRQQKKSWNDYMIGCVILLSRNHIPLTYMKKCREFSSFTPDQVTNVNFPPPFSIQLPFFISILSPFRSTMCFNIFIKFQMRLYQTFRIGAVLGVASLNSVNPQIKTIRAVRAIPVMGES